MSRVGKYPVELPTGVTIAVVNNCLTAKGRLGELTLQLTDHVEATVENGSVTVKPRNNAARARMMWGTTRANIANMVKGVSTGTPRPWRSLEPGIAHRYREAISS